MMPSAFIGIDWSGAKGARQPGIQIAMAKANTDAPPQTIACPYHKYWSRDAVFAYLVDLAEQSADGAGPVLIGIDFAFAHPFHDTNAYYPGLDIAPLLPPKTPKDLWAKIEDICKAEANFYGGAMFAAPLFGDYYLSPRNHKAPKFASRRRICEEAARRAGRTPTPTFKAIGADNVATGSMAGMRFLHALSVRLGDKVKFWPFDFPDGLDAGNRDTCRLILTEIFPSLYFHAAGFNPAKGAARDPAFMSAALAHYNSAGVDAGFAPMGPDADEADAIISAAGLRHHASIEDRWNTPIEAQCEGWIFGVPSP